MNLRTVEVSAPTTFFELDLARADRLVFVIDRAVGVELEVVKAELTASIASLPDGLEIGVVFFGDGALASRGPLRLDPASRRRIDALIRTVEVAALPENPAAAMKRAHAMDPRRVILVAARLDRAAGRALLGELRPGVRVDTVGIGGAGDMLAALAGASGGDAIDR